MPSHLLGRLFVVYLLGPLRRWLPVITPTLAVLLVLTGPLAFMREAQLRGVSMKWDEGLFWTLSLFTITASPLMYPHLVYLRVLHFLAPALAASALIGAVIRILEERGPIFLSNFRRHAVIGGLGNLGATLARHLMKHRQQVVAIERKGDSPAIDEMRVAGASLVLVGDMTAAETLRRARAPFADRVFLVSRSDVANLDAAFQLRRLVELEGGASGRPPTIFAHCFDSGLADALGDRLTAAHEGPRGARIITFNSYRFAAKALIGDLLRERLLPSLRLEGGWCLQRTSWPEGGGPAGAGASAGGHRLEEPRGRVQSIEEDRRRLMAAFRVECDEVRDAPRFAVLGVGRFGRSVLRELLVVAPRASRFLIIDRSHEQAQATLEQLTSEEAARCEHFVGDATAGVVVARVAEFAPTAALICTDSDLGNLRLAIELRRRAIRAVTRMSGSDAAHLSRGLDKQGITVVNIARLFRAAIPILTHEQQLRACINLDVLRTEELDHLYYLAQVPASELKRLGTAAVALRDLPGANAMPEAAETSSLALIWHREVEGLPI